MVYTIITPYLVPEELQNTKAVNIGDGFILTAIQRLLYPFECKFTLTSRKKLTEENIEQINSSRAVILAGANQLNDNFSIAPSFTLEILDKIKVPVIPFGVGIHGHLDKNQSMSEPTKELLRKLHERVKFTSWRCPLTVSYLTTHLPELADQYLMTGCPVMYGDAGLSGTWADCDLNRIVVTVTERGNFWERETQTLRFVAKRYPRAQKILSLHQDFVALEQTNQITKVLNLLQFHSEQKLPKHHKPTPKDLRHYARKLGYQIFIPQGVDECLEFYRTAELHYGSRLHAHLWFLSQGVKSFLTYVDDRCVGFSKSLGFPLCDPSHFEQHEDLDIHSYQQRCREQFTVMSTFVNYLKMEIL